VTELVSRFLLWYVVCSNSRTRQDFGIADLFCRLQFQTLCRLQFQMLCHRGFSKASDDLSPSFSDTLSPSVSDCLVCLRGFSKASDDLLPSVSDAMPVEHTVHFEPSKKQGKWRRCTIICITSAHSRLFAMPQCTTFVSVIPQNIRTAPLYQNARPVCPNLTHTFSPGL
jgi:hypothetical protein